MAFTQGRDARRYALEPLRAALEREGRSQAWLGRQLGERMGVRLKQQTLSGYLNGYTRVSAQVLSAVCWLAGVREADIRARMADEDALVQPVKKPAKARNRRTRATGNKSGQRGHKEGTK